MTTPNIVDNPGFELHYSMPDIPSTVRASSLPWKEAQQFVISQRRRLLIGDLDCDD
jgi:hypothetical protein